MKKLISLFILLIVTISINAQTETIKLKGKIDGKYPFSMKLDINKSMGIVSGSYYYDKKPNQKIKLIGEHKSGNISLRERVNNKVTGTFEFHILNGDGDIEKNNTFRYFDMKGNEYFINGTWENTNKEYDVIFTYVFYCPKPKNESSKTASFSKKYIICKDELIKKAITSLGIPEDKVFYKRIRIEKFPSKENEFIVFIPEFAGIASELGLGEEINEEADNKGNIYYYHIVILNNNGDVKQIYSETKTDFLYDNPSSYGAIFEWDGTRIDTNRYNISKDVTAFGIIFYLDASGSAYVARTEYLSLFMITKDDKITKVAKIKIGGLGGDAIWQETSTDLKIDSSDINKIFYDIHVDKYELDRKSDYGGGSWGENIPDTLGVDYYKTILCYNDENKLYEEKYSKKTYSTKQYIGKISGKYLFKMKIKLDYESNKIKGEYFYTKKPNQIIRLEGELINGRYEMDEFLDHIKTGHFSLYPGSLTVRGTWTNEDGAKTYDIEFESAY